MKRFYKTVEVGAVEGGHRVLLDGRGIRSVGGRAQIVPSAPLAEAMAVEWAGQGEEIDAGAFILRDMADYALDVMGADRALAIRDLLPYAETDTLCYRAEPDAPLHARQMEIWEPLLHAAEQRYDVHFERISGIIHCPQPEATMARMETALRAESNFALAALRNLASLSSSLVIGLAALAPDADAGQLWRAANLEEDWQAELWGRDAEAEARRERRQGAFATAMRFAALARG